MSNKYFLLGFSCQKWFSYSVGSIHVKSDHYLNEKEMKDEITKNLKNNFENSECVITSYSILEKEAYEKMIEK